MYYLLNIEIYIYIYVRRTVFLNTDQKELGIFVCPGLAVDDPADRQEIEMCQFLVHQAQLITYKHPYNVTTTDWDKLLVVASTSIR